MRSRTLPKYQEWADKNPSAADYVDRAYLLCEKLYAYGGDEIVELYTPDDIIAKFKTLNDIRRLINWPSPPLER